MDARVKPLEWRKSAFGNTLERADTIVGSYRIWTHPEADGVWFWSLQGGREGKTPDFAAAKAGAQADYERIILSALAPTQE